MATSKPRITITLEPEHYAVVRRLADLQETSMTKVIVQFFGEVAPILSKVADSLEAARRASDEARAKFVRAAEVAEEELRPLAEMVRNQFDFYAYELSRLSESAEPENPRPVITGVTKGENLKKRGRAETVEVHQKGKSDEV